MRNTHRTAEGETMFISQMDDNHLENTVKMHLKNIKECNNIISNANTGSNTIDMIVGGYDEENIKEKAKAMLIRSHEELGKYLIEVLIRGLDFSKDFQETFGRKGKLEDLGIFKKNITQKYLCDDGDYNFHGDDF